MKICLDPPRNVLANGHPGEADWAYHPAVDIAQDYRNGSNANDFYNMETRRSTPLLKMKGRTWIATRNIRTLYEAPKAAQVASEMRQYNISVLAICESRWSRSGYNWRAVTLLWA